MPERKMFNRLAKRLYYSGISIDRITWLNGVGEDENGVRDYLEDDVLNRAEEMIEETFGKEQGAFLNALYDEGDVDEAVDEILRQDGWLVQASYRQPDPKTITFRDNGPTTWMSAPWLLTHCFYHRDLSIALCKALLWGIRQKRRAFAEARRIQEDRQ